MSVKQVLSLNQNHAPQDTIKQRPTEQIHALSVMKANIVQDKEPSPNLLAQMVSDASILNLVIFSQSFALQESFVTVVKLARKPI